MLYILYIYICRVSTNISSKTQKPLNLNANIGFKWKELTSQ